MSVSGSMLFAQVFLGQSAAGLAGLVAAYLVWLAIVAAVIAAIHHLFTRPLHRAERARLFLDVIEGALNRGQPVEETLISLARSRDQTLGVRFHLVAAHLEDGLRLSAALERVPRFLLPQISAMLRAGERLGDLRSVLPASREILRDRPEGVRGAANYLMAFVFLLSPGTIGVMIMTLVFVVPRFKEVAAGFSAPLWPPAQFVFAHVPWVVGFEVVLFWLVMFTAFFYEGGPVLARRFQLRIFPLVDWLAWHIPWKRKRLQRTFSAILAVLLDHGVPEAEAIQLAGDCTVNEICRRRAEAVIAQLRSGARLSEAVEAFDDRGEFKWRLANGRQGGKFLPALRGWHEALDAKAFQQEEAAAQLVTTGMVMANGLVVALITTAMFGLLITLLNAVLAKT